MPTGTALKQAQGDAAVAVYDTFDLPGYEIVARSDEVPGMPDNGYFGILYRNEDDGTLIWAHRGTDGIDDVVDDIQIGSPSLFGSVGHVLGALFGLNVNQNIMRLKELFLHKKFFAFHLAIFSLLIPFLASCAESAPGQGVNMSPIIPVTEGEYRWSEDIRINFVGSDADLEIIRQAVSDLPGLPIRITVDNNNSNFFIRPFGFHTDIIDQRYRVFHRGWHVFRDRITFKGVRDWPEYEIWNEPGYIFQLPFIPLTILSENSGLDEEFIRYHLIKFRSYDESSIIINGFSIFDDEDILFSECHYFQVLPDFIKRKLLRECMLRGLGLAMSEGSDDKSLLRKYTADDVDDLPVAYSPGDIRDVVSIYNDSTGGVK